MANSEQTFLDEVRRDFLAEVPLGYWRKMHGGPFQAGMPDVLVAAPRAAALVEFKWTTRLDAKIGDILAGALTERQKLELLSLARAEAPLLARVLLGAVDPESGVCIAVGLEAAARPHQTMRELFDSRFLVSLGAGAEYSFRLRGERWHALDLLFGERE